MTLNEANGWMWINGSDHEKHRSDSQEREHMLVD